MYQLNLPEQTVAAALTSLSEQTDIQVLFPYDIATQHQSTALVGNYPLQQALSILLLNTGLHGGLTDSGVITISRTGSNVDINQNGKGKRMNTNKRKTVLATMVGLFATGGMATAIAQGVPEESSGFQLEEVVVTAQKREQNLQGVGISVNAFSGGRLKSSGVGDTWDLEMVSPGVNIGSIDKIPKIFIRGVGSTRLSGPGADSSSSVYVDGVYQARFLSAVVDVLDLDRVEVLKGPQGTLYGRNSTGGAIKYVSKAPDSDLGGGLSVEKGNYDFTKVDANLNIPLIQDKLLFRGSVVKQARDGFTENVVNSSYDADKEDLVSSRFTVNYIATSNLDITIHATAVNDDGDPPGKKNFINLDDPGIYGDALILDDPREVASNFGPPSAEVRNRALDATINWDLGWANLTTITAYNDMQMMPWREDVDATELTHMQQGVDDADGLSGDSQALSHEMLLSSNDSERLEWIAGLYYLKEDATWLSGFDFTLPVFQSFFSNLGINETNAYAAFGQVGYFVNEKTRLNAGLRYSYEEKKFASMLQNNFIPGPLVKQEDNWSDVSSKVGVDYFFSDDVMIYLTASSGFKSGAFNFTGGPAVDPEYIDAYELGAKTTLLDGRVKLNTSAFYYDYTDLQVENFDRDLGVSIIENAAEATISGLELSFDGLITEDFRLGIDLAWLDATFDSFTAFKNGGPEDVSGNDMPLAPEFTSNVNFSYTHNIKNLGVLVARVDYYYSSKKYFDQFNEDPLVQGSYDVVNARVSLESFSEDWSVYLFGKNITDEVIVSGGFQAGGTGSGYIGSLRPPRTYGLGVSYSF